MGIKTPVLDDRTSEDVYRQALELARYYCPEWAGSRGPDHFDPDDPSLVIFKIFSDMAHYLITQFNRIPEKHFLAFLDLVGMDLQPARPSIVPLTFYLSGGITRTEVPPGTRVASSKDPDVVFETTQHLSVLPVKLHAFSINPQLDSYTDHSGVISGERIFSIITGDIEEKPLDHIFYIGDDILNGKTPFENIRFKFKGSSLSTEFFKRWYGNKDIQLDVRINLQENKNELTFDIRNTPVLERSSVNNITSFWIRIRPDEKKRITKGTDLPVISNITVDVVSGGILPESIFFNDVPLDIKKGFYPFGQLPKEGDTFYISSDEVLSKENSIITLNIELEKELENEDVELSWEFWDGISWKTLPIIQDGTNSFTKPKTGKVEFICPSVAESEINGKPGRWIRVKLKSGGYGNPGKYEQYQLDEVINLLPGSFDRKVIKDELEKKGISFGLRYVQPSYDPPFIKSFHFMYSCADRKIQHILAYNNFSYKYFNNSDNVIPFEPFQNELPAFYLGFEEIAANMQISLYFAIKEISNNETPSFKWEYYDRTAWKELFIENDETKSFQKSGIVNFIFPHEIKKNTEFGKELFWIRVEPSYIRQLLWPELKGIFPNTVWASNHITVNNEILGSGNGMPGQSFSLSRRPVLCGHVIEIKEGENWIKWNETGSFALSNKLSRDYVIDRTGGMIFFGDGIHGMALPKGKNNIRAGFYRSGGGNRGNQEIGAINTLRKANPDIELVTNHVPSFGGEDEEDNEHAVFRGPNTIKNRGYAVTAEDFEWLALEASTEVLRAKCVTDKKNRINIIILPDRKDEAPLPEISLKDSIGKYLKERAFFAIREKIYVLGPDYKRIDSETTVRPLLLEESSIVSERIKSRLRTFFDPVRGGRYGKGYDFGQKIYLSEVAAVIEDIEGVECVEDLILKKIVGDNIVEEVSGSGRIDMEKNALPRAGNIEVKIGN